MTTRTTRVVHYLHLQLTSELRMKFNSPEEVERQFGRACKKLTEVEVNVNMFKKMIKSGVTTNDVRHFVVNQSKLKRISQKVNMSLARSAMKIKLNDACAEANRLRQEKCRLKRVLRHSFKYSNSRCKGVVRLALEKAKNHRIERKNKATKKFELCSKKMYQIIDEENFKDIPEDVLEIVKGVNVFNEELTAEPSMAPMVCDPTIRLDKCEMAFL